MIDQEKTIAAIRQIGEGFLALSRALGDSPTRADHMADQRMARRDAQDIVKDFKCPLCGGYMIARSVRATGEFFAGCGKYPECKGTRNLNGVAGKQKNPVQEVPPVQEDDDELPM